jgi:hypothetical protein
MKQQYQQKYSGRKAHALIAALSCLVAAPGHAALNSYSFIWSENYVQAANNIQPSPAETYNFELSLNFGAAADVDSV